MVRIAKAMILESAAASRANWPLVIECPTLNACKQRQVADRLSLVNEVQVLLHKSSEMIGNEQVFLAGVNFSTTLGGQLARCVKADGQGELLHPPGGLAGFANKVFECGGTGSSQVVKFQLFGHGPWCPSSVPADGVD
jgi:hypothetical protein